MAANFEKMYVPSLEKLSETPKLMFIWCIFMRYRVFQNGIRLVLPELVRFTVCMKNMKIVDNINYLN